jgi:hypothetical protein
MRVAGQPLIVPRRLFEVARTDPRYADACRRGDILPNPELPVGGLEVYRR